MEETIIRKVQPHSVEAEQAVLASMLMNREAVVNVADMLMKDDFYQVQYGVIFEAMVELYHEGASIDMITLTERLKEKGVPENVYSIEVMQELLNVVPVSTNAKKYAEIVKDRANMRRLIKMAETTANECYSLKDSSANILSNVENQVLELSQSGGNGDDFTPIREVVDNVLRNIRKASKQQGNITGVPTGFLDLDDMLTGLHGSELILIAARPAMGKTAFVLNIAEYVILKTDVPVAIFNFEMNKEQLVQRMIAMESQVNSQNIRTGNLQDDQWMKLYESSNIIGSTKLFIEDQSNVTIGDIRNKCRKLKQRHNVGLIIIDYLQLMSGNGRTDSRQQEVSEISRGLKVLAKELDVPIIALSQLSRAVEARTDHRPMLSDLRESGSIEQDADVVMFIYREDKYRDDLPEEDKNKAEIIIAKQRNGATGTVMLGWQGEYTKFVNLEHSRRS
ncbi:replicative DNA helicase [Clostridium sp. CAG:632]|jgi:replicative DNA helicase|nr:replicative DNA helicase [Lachnospiraceae bacterium]MBS6467333.1 replicative DNA helicase [Clostridium sp.]MDD6267596.1 replicative DNA helicase [Clostridium sp.]CCY59597.1 replicative DNA helicase [Clostridium sp. CAG:632]